MYATHLLVNFGGTVGTANPEIWSCGIRLWCDNWSGFDEIGYANDIAKPAAAAWIARATSLVSNAVSLDWIKVNMIGPDGKYLEGGNPHTLFYTPVVTGTTTGVTLPYQACVVLSWRSNEVTRGPASKGRIYSPHPGTLVASATGLFPTADAAGMATSAATFLNTLDVGSAGEVVRPSIMSNIGAAHHQIDSVVVDNRIDIQRRRANNLVAASSTAVVAY